MLLLCGQVCRVKVRRRHICVRHQFNHNVAFPHNSADILRHIKVNRLHTSRRTKFHRASQVCAHAVQALRTCNRRVDHLVLISSCHHIRVHIHRIIHIKIFTARKSSRACIFPNLLRRTRYRHARPLRICVNYAASLIQRHIKITIKLVRNRRAIKLGEHTRSSITLVDRSPWHHITPATCTILHQRLWRVPGTASGIDSHASVGSTVIIQRRVRRVRIFPSGFVNHRKIHSIVAAPRRHANFLLFNFQRANLAAIHIRRRRDDRSKVHIAVSFQRSRSFSHGRLFLFCQGTALFFGCRSHSIVRRTCVRIECQIDRAPGDASAHIRRRIRLSYYIWRHDKRERKNRRRDNCSSQQPPNERNLTNCAQLMVSIHLSSYVHKHYYNR